MAIPSNMQFPQEFKDIFGEPPPPASSGLYENSKSPSRAKQLADTEYLQHFSTFLNKSDIPLDDDYAAFVALCEKCEMGTPKPFLFLRNGTEENIGFGFSGTKFPFRWESLYIARNAPLQVVATYQTRLIKEFQIPVPEKILANIIPFETRKLNSELLKQQTQTN